MNKARDRSNEWEFSRCLDEKQTIRRVKKSRRNKERKTKRERVKKKRKKYNRGGDPFPCLLLSDTREDGEVWKARGKEDRRKGEFLWKGQREVSGELQAAREGPGRTTRRRKSERDRETAADNEKTSHGDWTEESKLLKKRRKRKKGKHQKETGRCEEWA